MSLLRWKKNLQQISNYWFFPAIISIGTVFLLLEPNWLIGMVWFFLFYRILCTRNQLIIRVSLLCVLILVVLIFNSASNEQQKKYLEDKEVLGELTVFPDQLKIDGDSLQMEGDFSVRGRKKQKIICFYRLPSEQEKESWQKEHQVLRIKLSGDITNPITQTNLNGFDYQKYLRRQGIYQTVTMKRIYQVTKVKPKFYELTAWLSIIRKKGIDYCDSIFLAETALHLKTLIFGYKPSEFSQKESVLSDLGILHLFSLSGMHVTFFIGSFRYFILRSRVTVERIFGFQLFFSFFYMGVTGFSVSVVRAVTQSIISLCNRQFHWMLSSLDCWSLSLLLGLFLNPYLLFSVGGQLSYGLSFFILYVHPSVEKIKNKYLRMYSFSLLLNMLTIPLIGCSFFEWQLMGSFFTFLLLPIFERVVLPALSIGLISSFFVKIPVVVWGLEVYFSLQESLFIWLSQIKRLRIVTGAFSPMVFLLSCILLFYLLHLLTNKSKKLYFVAIGIMFVLFNKYFSPTGTIAFIDVGQGDSIFIQAPFHQENVLIDTGGKINFEKESWMLKAREKANAEYSVIPFLKSKGVKYLDKVLITHGDADHCGDLLIINEKIPIRTLYYPRGTETKPIFRRMLNQLKKSGTMCVPALGTATISANLSLQMLAPKTTGMGENNDSMVVYTKIADRRFLFTGDLEKEGEQQFINDFPTLKVDVLKVGHHGSKTSSDPAFIQSLHPLESIISCGRNNRFNHPHPETLSTLKQNEVKIFQTNRHGMIYYQWTPFSKMSAAKVLIKEN